MAEETRTSIKTLESTTHIPIAQLTPLLLAPSSRAIKAVVTLIWPYSSATKAVAFLLAEPDFRLRRTRGQVRVQFSGSSAKEINSSGIESGDEVTLCLEGAEFVHGETVLTPGRGVEFELRFTERLLLESRQQETLKLSILDIDHPDIEAELPNNGVATNPTPEAEFQPSITSTPTRPEAKLADDEFSSPAFIKRARTSYGSLWEDDFEAGDGSVKGKGRKRTRMSDTWTITTRELTPESDEVEEPELETNLVSPSKPTNETSMMDEGVQTDDLDMGASEALLEFAKQPFKSSHGGYGTQEPVVSNGTLEFQPPPVIFTNSLPIQQDTTQMRPPSSPRLQPLSSENLPLVSPLLSRSVASFSDPIGQPSRQIPGGLQGFAPASNTPYTKGGMVNESRIKFVTAGGDGNTSDFQGLGEDESEADDSNVSGLEPQVHPEHQYGNWQTQSAQFGFEEPNGVTEEHGNTHRFSIEEHDDDRYENLQSPISPVISAPFQQHPNLDEFESEGGNPSSWEPIPDSIPYPELPDHGDNLDELVQSLSGPQSRVLSRSSSVQSAVIDLTESDNEDEIEEEEGDTAITDLQRDLHTSETPASRSYDDPAEEGYEEESEEEAYDDENELPTDGVRHSSREGHVLEGDEQSEGSEEDENESVPGEEYYDEEELDSQGNPYPPGHLEDEDLEDDEEESYDEDEDDELPARPVLQRAPIIIDLLSSDDEDEAESILATSGPIPLRQTEEVGNNESESSSEDESEAELDVNDEQMQPHFGRSPMPTAEEDGKDEGVDEHDQQFSLKASQARFATKTEGDDLDEESVESVEEESDEEIDDTFTQIPISTELVGSVGDESHASSAKGEALADTPHEIPASEGLLELSDGEPQSLVQDNENDIRREFAVELVLDAPNENGNLNVQTQEAASALETSQEMEVDVLESQEPAAPTPKRDIRKRSRSASRVFGLDGTDDDAEPDRGINVDLSSYHAMQPSLMGNTSRPSPQRPSLFSRMFSIDGANDEPDGRVFHPTLPNEELSPPSTATNSQPLSQSFGVRFPIGSAQLPTPDESQLTQNVISQQSSFTSAAAPSQEEIDTSIEAFETITKTDISEQFETFGANTDTMEIDSIAFKDIASEAVQEQIELSEAIDTIMETNLIVSKDATIDETQEETIASEANIITDVDLVASQNVANNAISEQLAFEIGETGMEADSSVSGVAEEFEVQTVSERITIVQETVKLPIDKEASEQSGEINTEEVENDETTELSPKKSSREAHFTDEHAFTLESPRRSHRRVKSTPKAIARQEDNRPAPVTPLKSTRTATPGSARSDRDSPMVVIDKRSAQKGHDASIELALSSLDSPETHRDIQRSPMTNLKLRLNRNLRTELEEYKSLKILRYELNNKKFNVLAIATAGTPEPERAKNGPRHYLITFNITDPSVAPAGVTEVQIFRPYKQALPIIQVGDGVLLRDFQVVSLKNRGFGLKSDPGSSSWAVFKGGVEVEVRGPPVEYGEGEVNHMAQMKEWYASLDSASVAKLGRANGDKSSSAGA